MAKQPVRKTNWFAIWTSIAVVVVVAAVAIVVVLGNQAANKLPAENIPAAVDQTTGAVTVGNGPDKIATYVDFMCPYCEQFETAYSPQLRELAQDNKISLSIHAVSILDRASQGTNYSTRAANAFYCVADTKPELALSFLDALYLKQPKENTPGLSDDKLIDMASNIGADISTCQKDQKFADFVTKMTANQMPTSPDGGRGTPTITINGEYTPLGTFNSPTYFTDRFGGKAAQ